MAARDSGPPESPKYVLFDPGKVPVEGISSVLMPSSLPPGVHQNLSNLRWINKALKVRGGTAQVLPIPVANAVPIDCWSGTLNGTTYLVAAYSLAGKMLVFQATDFTGAGNWTEITSPNSATNLTGDASGNSRFPSVTSRVSFSPVKVPAQNVAGGVAQASHDVLVIQNGTDTPLVWNPLAAVPVALPLHKAITLPTNAANSFRYVATFSAFHPVATGSASQKTYFAGGVVNAANHHTFSDTVAVYTGANAVINWTKSTVGPIANGDIAAVKFTSAITLKNKDLGIVIEGNPNTVLAMFAASKVEINGDASHAYNTVTLSWVMLHDPTVSGTGTTAYLKDPPQVVALDAASNRYMYVFSAAFLNNNTDRAFSHMRFTHIGAAPAATQAVAILAIVAGGAWPGGTQFGMNYKDDYSQAESVGFLANSATLDVLSNIGGPASITTQIALLQQIGYDYKLFFRQYDLAGATINGGLNGLATTANFYVLLPRPSALAPATNNDYLFAVSYSLYAPIAGAWVRVDNLHQTLLTITSDSNWFGVDTTTLDGGRQLPMPSHVCMPIGATMLAAAGRLLVANLKDIGTNTQGGELWGSVDQKPFRFSQVVDFPWSGFKVILPGETVQTVLNSAAGAQGMSYIYFWTDKTFNMLGAENGRYGVIISNFSGSGLDARQLGSPYRIASIGTNAMRTPAEFLGTIIWQDNEGYVQQYEPGSPHPVNVSRETIDDQLQAVPGARRAQVCGTFFKHIYYMPFSTPGQPTSNGAIAGYNLYLGKWEFVDVPPAPATAERVIQVFDSTKAGGGKRLMLLSANGVVYAYEEGTQDLGANIAYKITTREISEGPEWALTCDCVWIVTDIASGVITVSRKYRPYGSTYTTTIDPSVSGSAGWLTDASKPHTELVAPSDSNSERGSGVYLDFSGSALGGKSFFMIVAGMDTPSSVEAVTA